MFQINWKIKAFIYKVLVFINSQRLLSFIQKNITKRSAIKINKVKEEWILHQKVIKDYKINNLIEFGAGKTLEQNIYFFLNNKRKINQLVLDLYPIIDFELVNQAYNRIVNILKKEKKFEITNSDVLLKLNINYMSPFDKKKIKKNFFDLCTSTNTLEHLTRKEILNFISIINFSLKKKGLLSLAIDCSDHYSHTDNKISSLNFFKFSKKEWDSKYNNKYLYQNRLRYDDYIKIFKKHFRILKIKKGNFGDAPKDQKKYFTKKKNNYILWFHVVLQK